MSEARWGDPREYDVRDCGDELPCVYDPRDRDEHDPRDGLMRDLDLPRRASLDYKQRLQQLFFPEGIAYGGNRFNRTAATAPLFSYLASSESADERVVSRFCSSAVAAL